MLCTSLPLFHTNALNTFYQALLIGSHVCYEKRFSASGFFRVAHATARPSPTCSAPWCRSCCRGRCRRKKRAHQVRIALAPGVPAQFHAEFTRRTGIRLLDGWGSTETNFVLGTTIDRQQPGLMGPVFESFQARVVDDQDKTSPTGPPGELIVRADEPLAFATGIFRHAREDRRSLARSSGSTPAIVSCARPDGYFRFVDRLKDAIRRRGENISSFEVEQVLLSHPAVANAAAFPVRSSLAEDEVMAAVILHPGRTLDGSRADRVLRAAPALFRGPALSRIRRASCRAPRAARCRNTN